MKCAGSTTGMSSCTTPTGNASPCSSQNARRQSLFCAIRSDSSQRKRVTCVRRRGRENVRAEEGGRPGGRSCRSGGCSPSRSRSPCGRATPRGGRPPRRHRSSESTNMSSSPPARADAGVARGSRAPRSPAHEHGSARILLGHARGDRRRRVGRAVVDHHHLESRRTSARAGTRGTPPGRPRRCKDRHDDADPGHRRYRWRARGVPSGAGGGGQAAARARRLSAPPPVVSRRRRLLGAPAIAAAPRGARARAPAPAARSGAARRAARDADRPRQRVRDGRHRAHDVHPRRRARPSATRSRSSASAATPRGRSSPTRRASPSPCSTTASARARRASGCSARSPACSSIRRTTRTALQPAHGPRAAPPAAARRAARS